MNTKYPKIIALLVWILIASCSRNKDRLINRGFHAMTTRNNILYNGGLAFESGLNEINEKYQDSYWEVLPIEPLEIEEVSIKSLNLDDNEGAKEKKEKKATSFDVAESKAVKAIQKHSMLIDGEERNWKIDEAFLLLGQSRYYSQRFVPALEAFNYVIRNYPEASLIDETIIWKAKTNIRLENEDVAIQDLENLLKKEELPEEILEDAYTTSAMAFKKLDSIPMVIEQLKKAIQFSKDKQKKARNSIILGQLYRKTNQIELSQMAFQEVVDTRRAPYKYRLHAEIEKLKNFQKGDSISPIIKKLEKLIKNRDNRPYLDELYYQYAVIDGIVENRDGEVENYQKSIHAIGAKDFQKGLSYEGLGNLHFKEADYKKAGSYFDSVIQVSGELNTRRIRRIKKKRAGLDAVLVFEEIIKRNDSLWNIISLNDEDKQFYFESYIKDLKEKEEALRKEEEEKKRLAKFQDLAGAGFASSGTQPIGGPRGKWYFYNTQTLAYGSQEFRRIWGTRKLEDNWRWSDKSTIEEEIVIENEESLDSVTSTVVPPRHKVSHYLSQLPSTDKEIDSIAKLRTTTYYQLGLLYKEQFKEFILASETLEKLLTIEPDEKLTLGANYQLYKIFSALKNEEKAAYYKNAVLEKFPESVFAQMILNPYDIEAMEENGLTPEAGYKKIYKKYESRRYTDVLSEIPDALLIFEGTSIVPKLELLRAYTLMKVEGKEAFKEALDYIILNYVNSEEGKKAKELLNKL